MHTRAVDNRTITPVKPGEYVGYIPTQLMQDYDLHKRTDAEMHTMMDTAVAQSISRCCRIYIPTATAHEADRVADFIGRIPGAVLWYTEPSTGKLTWKGLTADGMEWCISTRQGTVSR